VEELAVAEETSSGYRPWFAGLYIVLGGLLVAGIAVFVVFMAQPGSPKPPSWSAWKPAGGSAQRMTSEIADHISRGYLVKKDGGQLVAIIPSSPELTQGTAVSNVSTICTLQNANAQSCSRILGTSGDIQMQLCGLGEACSIQRGTATAARERLLRREALEVALYTFKYVPTANAVIAYLPPPPGQEPLTVLFLERANLSKELSMPLSKTLPLTTPPLPSQADTQEQKTVDKLTLPVEYSFKYQKLTDGTEAIILVPAT
jgi:hypothetical protein